MEFTQEEIELIYDKANSYSTGLLTTSEVQWLKHNDEDALANVLYNYTTGFLRKNPQYYQMIDDVVNTIVFLLSDLSCKITGRKIFVDAGRLL